MTARSEAQWLLEGLAAAVLIVASLHAGPSGPSMTAAPIQPFERPYASLSPTLQERAQLGFAQLATAELHAGLGSLPKWVDELNRQGTRARHVQAVVGGAEMVIMTDALLVITPTTASSDDHIRLADGRFAHASLWMTDAQRSLLSMTDDDAWVPAARGLVRITTTATTTTIAGTPPPARIGITLHPYFSWLREVVEGTNIEVVAVLPEDVDAGDYRPRAADIATIAGVDTMVVNGIGHDDFISGMIAATGKPVRRIVVNDGAPLLVHNDVINSHSFLSVTMAIQQTTVLARTLGALRPLDAATFATNALGYHARLWPMLEAARQRLRLLNRPRVVTIHDGYGYLLQELGIELAGVVEPAHGLLPSAAELSAMIALSQAKHIGVVVAEARLPSSLRVPLEEVGCQVIEVSHIASGPFATERFETDMAANINTIVTALEQLEQQLEQR